MASAEKYAQWIVENEDKKGTADFDTVVAAYQEAKKQEGAPPQELPTTPAEPPGFLERVGDVFTGSLRETEATQTLQDWGDMPEMNTFSLSSFKSALGTMLTSPEETVQVIKNNFPGVSVRQDEKGNFIMKSSIDGKEYAIKPGFRPSDIPRVGAGLAAFTPAGRAATTAGQIGGAAATQAVIEGSQAAMGGSFDPAEVPIAGALGGAGHLAGKGLEAGTAKIKDALRGVRDPVGEVAEQVVEEAAPTAAQTPTELAGTARKATGGVYKTPAIKTLAEQAMPDQKTVEAAERLGISEYLQPDHVSTNQSYRELAQAVKSIPGSEARAQELAGYEQIAKRADGLIEDLGGTLDMSSLDPLVKNRLTSIQQELDGVSEKFYGEVSAAIPKTAEAPATNLVQFLERQISDLGGVDNLSAQEKALYKQLRPKAAPGEVLETVKQPTYALLDKKRKELTSARVKGTGPFKDEDVGLIKRLERALLEDQKAVAEQYGVGEVFDLARQSVAIRKSVESDMVSLFGKALDRSILKTLDTSIKKLSTGDVSDFIRTLGAIPGNRQEVVASALGSAFGKNARNGNINFTSYARWYEGLLKNKRAHTALMTNLPTHARKRLSDLYRVSNGIRKASKERITTGRIEAVRRQVQGADNLIGKIYDFTKRASTGIAAEAVTSSMGLPGAGLASGLTAAAMTGGKNTLKAADELISSPEFLAMAKDGTEPAAKKFVGSRAFKKFHKAVGGDRAMSNPEQWVLSAFQTKRQFEDNNE